MKFGVKLPNSGPFASAECLRTVALEAEALGYDSVWVHDHIHRSVADAQHHFVAGSAEAWKPPVLPNVFEAIATLLYISGITTRVALGTSILVLPLRNPVVLAKQTACLDQFSNGRLVLGVAIGGGVYAQAELAAVGALHLMGKRGKVVDEWIDVMRGVWREAKYSLDGRFIKVTDAEVYPKPLQQPSPPVWIGGFGEAALRRTARRGDGWLPMYFLPQEIEQGRQRLGVLAAKASRDPQAIQIGNEHWLSIAARNSDAEARAASTIQGLGSYLGRQGSHDSGRYLHQFERNFVGDPDTILTRVAAYQKAGVDHVILRVIAHSFDQMIESLHLFKEKVRDRLF